jgi:hypothetical protein
MNEHVSYSFFQKVDESTKLGKLINTAFDKLITVRMMCCPQFYAQETENQKALTSGLFYDLCLGELYLHSLVENLHQWQEILYKYNGEFEGRWKYYAASKRLDYIKADGGDEDDYLEDGSVKTNISEEELTQYSVVDDLVPDYCRSIFLDTKPENLMRFFQYIVINSNLNINDVFQRATGKTLKTYRIEDEEMVENTFVDELFLKIDKEDSATLVVNTLFSVVLQINILIKKISELNKANDNRQFLSMLPKLIQDILDVKIELVNVFEQIK